MHSNSCHFFKTIFNSCIQTVVISSKIISNSCIRTVVIRSIFFSSVESSPGCKTARLRVRIDGQLCFVVPQRWRLKGSFAQSKIFSWKTSIERLNWIDFYLPFCNNITIYTISKKILKKKNIFIEGIIVDIICLLFNKC